MKTTRTTVVGALLAAAIAARPAHAQPPTPRLAFEVAAIKAHEPAAVRSSIDDSAPERFVATNASVEQYVSYAYEIRPGVLTGVPASMGGFRFDVIAKSRGPATIAEKREMVRTLLEERFKLKLRRDTKEGDVYALVLARADGRLGPNIHRSSDECDRVLDALARSDVGLSPDSEAVARCSGQTGGPNAQAGWTAKGFTMGRLATTLRDRSLQPVVDRTGLTGRFDFTLRSTLVGLDPRIGTIRPMPPDTADSAPSIFTALPEQLGLKLERQRGPVESFVVEHVELPLPD